MIRFVGGMLTVLALVGVLAAYAQNAPDKQKPQNKEPELIKLKPLEDEPGELKKLKPPKAPAKEKGKDKKVEELKPIGDTGPVKAGGGDAEDPKKVMARIAENLEATEDRLKKKDTGKETLDLQQKILDDFDKLIRRQQQNQKNQSGKSGGAQGQPKNQSGTSGAKPGQGKSGKGKSGAKPGQGSKPGQGKSGKGKSGDKPGQGNKPGQGKSGQQPKGGKGDKAGGKPGEASKNGKGGGGNEKPKDKKSTLDDLSYRNIWGHLPKVKRMDMDAYSRETFMPRYDRLLRQYYRTIAERARKNDE